MNVYALLRASRKYVSGPARGPFTPEMIILKKDILSISHFIWVRITAQDFTISLFVTMRPCIPDIFAGIFTGAMIRCKQGKLVIYLWL